MNIEKNDIDISKLFEYKKEFVIKGSDGTEVSTYVKIIGDEDLNRVRIHAIRKSSEMRKNLYNKKWEDREAYLPDISKYTKQQIINVVTSLQLQQITDDAIKNTDQSLSRPSDLKEEASLEEQEKHQEEIDEWPNHFNEKVAEIVTKAVEKKKREFNKITKKQLLVYYQESLIEAACVEILNKRFVEESTFMGTYLDDKYEITMFETFEEFQNAPSHLKKLLMANYKSLELSSSSLKV